MAFAAVISLKNTIQRLLNSPRITIVSPSREILDCAYEEVKSLQQVLERLEKGIKSSTTSERMKDLEGQMRETVCKLEDVLESHVSDQFLSQSEGLGNEGCSLILSLDLQELRQDIDCFTKTARKMEEEYTKGLDNLLLEKEDDYSVVSSSMDFGGNKFEMVGLSDQFHEIRDQVLSLNRNGAVSIIGMAGIGKTTLAKKIFQDPLILRNFECRCFVTMGQKSRLRDMLRAILAQANPDGNKMLMEENEELGENLYKSLKGRRFLIVLDDVWNADFWDDFGERLPEEQNGSVILMTTRREQVASSISLSNYDMRFLTKEESWDLLRRKVFVEEVCPPQLEKAGKKIAENCEGLPLLILTVADLLSKAEKTSECWTKVAADKENSIFVDAYDRISEVLYPSYNYLPQYLKACFLYMGVFPQNYEVRHSKLINLWRAEDFLEPNPSQSLENYVTKCMGELASSTLVLSRKWSFSKNRVKAWGIHSVYWHLSKREARNENFLRVFNIYESGLTEGMESTRRFSIYKNILLSIKDVYNSVVSISIVRSLLCTGPHHQYQVPLCFGLRLLRVLDALTIRFYEFPVEILKLVQLRYLSLTYNGNLPSSISKLWNLQCLIVHQHLRIKSFVPESYLPVEIWNLQELKYLQIMGRNLPDPHGAVLPNLLALLDVGIHSCTKSVLEGIPNLKKLRVQIELAHDAIEPLSCFEHISQLCELNSLKCVVLNPKLRSEIVATPPSLTVFTSCLRKLTLSGFGYPWKDMNKIAELPFLQVLKLQCYAFQGEKWEVEEKRFLRLMLLSIEDTDLVQWTVRGKTFPHLYFLNIINCYKLQEIPNISSLSEIHLVDCNPLAVTCAQQIKTKIYVHSSWDDRNLKS